MSGRVNEFGQPIGPALPGWSPPPLPPRQPLTGRYCRLDPLEPATHADDLFPAFAAGDGREWTYLPYGPFPLFDEFRDWLETYCQKDDPCFFAVIDARTGKAAGMVSFMRITPKAGSIEAGHIHFAECLKRTPATTEALFLMMRWAFEAGYRRYEWKCDTLNEPSWRAAERLGFTREGTFRQAAVYKGRGRDTAWYSIIDSEWPRLRTAFETWLAPENFDADGTQLVRLSTLTASGR